MPVRMESIPGVKTALVQDTPPPKPPRNDRPPSIEVVSGLGHSKPPVGQIYSTLIFSLYSILVAFEASAEYELD